MGICCSGPCQDRVPDNHPTKFKVTNVDDEGNELGSGVMELTQRELVLHTHKRDAVRWPYLCLRRYGYDSNLFSFESGRRCLTGQEIQNIFIQSSSCRCHVPVLVAMGFQSVSVHAIVRLVSSEETIDLWAMGIFAFKCSRAEEIFNLLQDLMQCNSINVVEEPVVITRNAAEVELTRTPQTPETLGYTVPGFPNGFHSFPMETSSCPAARHASMSGLRHSSLGEDSTHALLIPNEQSHTYVNTASGEEDIRGHHCLHSLPEVHPSVSHSNHNCTLEDRNPQVYLQPGEVKFVLGPALGYRHLMKCDGFCRPRWECPRHFCTPHNNNNECKNECLTPKCVYENLNGLLPSRGTLLHQSSRHLKISHEDLNPTSCSHRRTNLLHYENLPSLPPVWECQPLRQGQEEEDSGDAMTPSSTSYPEIEEEDPLRSYMNSERAALHGGMRRGGCLQQRRGCTPSVFNFDFRRPYVEQPKQLNYIQVELQDDPCKGHRSIPVPRVPCAVAHPAHRTNSYAVIDHKKTAAMSSLQRALPKDDGTSRKTRHNSTDLPL